MQSDRHARISIRAFEIWLAEGQVHGRDIEHWQRAEHEIGEEEIRMAAALADRAAGAAASLGRGRKAPAKAPAKAASAKPKAARRSGTAAALRGRGRAANRPAK